MRPTWGNSDLYATKRFVTPSIELIYFFAPGLTCAAGLGRVDTRRRASSADGGATGVQGRRYGHQNATDTGHDETRRLVAGAVESRQDGLVHGPGRRNRETVDDHL